MSRVALPVVVALLPATGFAADLFLPPYLDAGNTPGTTTADPSKFNAPMPTPATGASAFLPPPPTPADELPGDGPQQTHPMRSDIPIDSWSRERPPPEMRPVMQPPFNGDMMMPSPVCFPPLPQLSQSPAGYRFWAGAETLLWWEKNEHLPANLVTSGLPTDAVPGALGQPNTVGLSGPGNVQFNPFAGLRLFAGVWLDPQQIIGIESSAFVLQEQGHGASFNSTIGGNPLLALRYLNVAKGAQDAFVIASPSAKNGGIAMQTSSQLWGADVNILHAFWWSNGFHVVGLFGFRYLDLSEALSTQTRTMALDNSPISFLGRNFATPAFDLTTDQFHARSQFFGGQVGVRSEYYFSHFFVAATGKLAVGRTDEVINALGVSTLQIGTTPLLKTAGGLFALPSNSGHFDNQDFGIVPELQLKAGVLLTRWLRATIGYDVLYWSRVLRVGDTLNLIEDARQVPTRPSFQSSAAAHAPQPIFNPSSFWAQGLTFSLEFTY